MARLPDLDSLGSRPVPQSRRGVASNPRAGAVGQALEGIGENVTRIGSGMLEKEDRLAYAAARSALLRADVTARQELEADPDYETWETRYADRMKTAREQAGKLIRSRSDRTLFEADAELDITRGTAALGQNANARRRDGRVALGIEALENLQDVGQSAPDEATREATIRNANELIQGMVESGDIDAVKAGDLRRGWTENYIVQRAESLQLAGDLDEAAAFVGAHMGRLSSVTEMRLRRQIMGAIDDRDTLIEAESAVHSGLASPVDEDGSPSAPSGTAHDLVRNFEGFREGTYWDVNHHRVGYGSDTITTASGEVREVRPGDRVSQADAERDLSRRIQSIESTAVQRAGQGWEQLPEGARAAIVSVAYNYGEGHARLRPLWDAAARGDANAVANVIESFAGDNKGINRDRRRQEAETARSGTSQSPQQHNLNDIYARIDARSAELGWTPEKEESVKAQAARLVERDEALLNRQYRAAADEAAQAIAALPNGLTDIAQIPASVRAKMDPTDIAKLEQDIREERRERSEAAREAAQTRRATELRFMERFEPEKFRKINPLAEASRLSPEQYNGFMMNYLEANEEKPLDPVGIRGSITEEINFQERHGQLEFGDEEKVALFDFMEAQLNNIQASKGKVERADYAAAFQTAMRQIPGTGGWFGSDKRTFELLTEVPPDVEARIRRDWRGSQPPTKGQIISVWMQTRERGE